MNYKELLGILATAIALISYIPYFRDIFAGKTKPHAFSWFIWGLLTAIGFFGQVADNAGPGAWVTGFTALICFGIAVTALLKGQKDTIVLVDWLSLVGAGVALSFWYLTKGPLLSVILITLIDALGFFPTFRKSFYKPQEETKITYFLSGLKFVVALFALQNFSIITTLYPISLVVMNWLFVVMVTVRKRQLMIK
jgi:hypothetical protein